MTGFSSTAKHFERLSCSLIPAVDLHLFWVCTLPVCNPLQHRTCLVMRLRSERKFLHCLLTVTALYNDADGRGWRQGKEGVVFEWRHQGGRGSDGWQDDLAQLSGGQRSFCAVALLVAVSSCWLLRWPQTRCASARRRPLSGDADIQTCAHAALEVKAQVCMGTAT